MQSWLRRGSYLMDDLMFLLFLAFFRRGDFSELRRVSRMDPKRKFNINLSLICFMIIGFNLIYKTLCLLKLCCRVLQKRERRWNNVLSSIKTRLASTWNQHNSKASKRHVTKQIYIILQLCKAIIVNSMSPTYCSVFQRIPLVSPMFYCNTVLILRVWEIVFM